MIERIKFGEEAISYIREQLAFGRSLSKQILRSTNLDEGHVIAYLPEETSHGRLLTFQYGGIITTSESRLQTTNFVQKFLNQASDSYIIVEEEDWTLDNYPQIQESDEQFFVYEREIYSFLKSNSHSVDRVEFMLSLARTYPGFSFLVSGGSLPNIKDRAVVEAYTLERIALNIQHMLVQAYDAETFLIWSRS